jgi:signal peptidase II
MFKRGLYWIIGIILIDQISKYWILETFWSSNAPFSIPVTGFFELVLGWNKGVSFGLLASDNIYRQSIIISFTLLIVIGLMIWLRHNKRTSLSVILAFIIGGALGNLIDRLRFQAVIDFAHIHIGNFSWPVFNVADIAISVGVVLLMLDIFRKKT